MIEMNVTSDRYEHTQRSVFGSVETVTTVIVVYLNDRVSSVTERVEVYQSGEIIPEHRSRATTVTGSRSPLSFRVPSDKARMEHDLIRRFGFEKVIP